jgi:hypothetical protein
VPRDGSNKSLALLSILVGDNVTDGDEVGPTLEESCADPLLVAGWVDTLAVADIPGQSNQKSDRPGKCRIHRVMDGDPDPLGRLGDLRSLVEQIIKVRGETYVEN